MMPGIALSYDAALLTVLYSEGGIRYKETFFTAIEDYGHLMPGGWKNKSTFFARTPAEESKQWEPVAGIILSSVRLNPQWIAGEIQGQIKRGEIAAGVIRDVNRISREIAEHQQKTNAEINNDAFLTLTEQEEYVNPFSNDVEAGSNQWEHRWTNPGGDLIYTDNEDYDPNIDIDLNNWGYAPVSGTPYILYLAIRPGFAIVTTRTPAPIRPPKLDEQVVTTGIF